MIIRKYGIELHRLRFKEDIELVREKRNSEQVRQGMFYREPITTEMQAKWFESQNNRNNYHFIIHFEGRKTGLISGKNVDFNSGTSEGGIFIWDDKALGTPVPVIASVIMAELTFSLLGLEKTFAETRSDNQIALRYNQMLGYEVLNIIDSEKKVNLVLTSSNFKDKGARFQEAIRKAAGDSQPLSWKDIELDQVEENERQLLYTGFPQKIQCVIDNKLA